MAPTVLWGDDAELQRLAWTGEATQGIRAYRLWIAVAHVATRLLPGDPAWRVNVVSGLFAVAALVLCFLVARRSARTVPALLAAGCLAVSHTFWMHAVRAEVYSSYAAWFFLTLVLARRARGSGSSARWGLAFLAAGLGPFFHLMSVLLVVPLAGLAWADTRSGGRGRVALAAALAWAGGLAIFLAVGIATGAFAPGDAVGAGGAFAFLRAPMGLAYLLYQFPLVLPVALLGIRAEWARDRDWAGFVVLLFAVHFAFAHGVHAADQFVFFLGAWFACTLALASGFDALLRARTGLAFALFVAGVLAPPAVDLAAVWAARHANLPLPGPRQLPYRDNARFFLLPDKHGDRGAERYGAEALAALPEGAAILADPLPYQTLRWFQDVRGVRRDVRVEVILPGTGAQLPWLLEQSRERATYLAATGGYYDMAAIEQRFRVEPVAVVYRAMLGDSTGGRP